MPDPDISWAYFLYGEYLGECVVSFLNTEGAETVV